MSAGEQTLDYPAVSRYAVDMGFAETVTDLEEFVDLIYAMDGLYLERKRKERAGKSKKGKS